LHRACALVGVSRWTVQRWATAGRAAGASAEQREFAERLDRVRAGERTVADGNGHGELSDDEALRLLAIAARRGSVSALTELRRRGQDLPAEPVSPVYPADHPLAWTTDDDPFLALEPESMAELSPEQQQRAREVSEAAHERGVAGIERSRRVRAAE